MSVKAALLTILVISICSCMKTKKIEKTDTASYNQRYRNAISKANKQAEALHVEEGPIKSAFTGITISKDANRTRRTLVSDKHKLYFVCEESIDDHISLEYVCDGFHHCGFGSDEINCDTFKCPNDLYFRCKSGSCLEIEYQCDGGKKDCYDKSDEKDCKTAKCPAGYFRCKSGQCVAYHYKCDGKPHCNDKSDESGCSSSNITCPEGYYKCNDGTCMNPMFLCDYAYPNPPFCSKEFNLLICKNYTCKNTTASFQCNSGLCISRQSLCDMQSNCPGGEDEIDCKSHKCMYPSSLMFRCDTGHCIMNKHRCDNRYNCLDGKDERDCYTRNCSDFTYRRCKHSGKCFDIEQQCDETRHCLDNTDETSCEDAICPEEYFRCNSGQCVIYLFRCNGRNDCKDKSDEADCQSLTCPPGYSMCSNGGCMNRTFLCEHSFQRYSSHFTSCSEEFDEVTCEGYTCRHQDDFQCGSGYCIDKDLLCNNVADCPNGTDESSCGNHNCTKPEEEFKCTSGHCISKRLQCNSRSDCRDGSDENTCEDVCPGFRCLESDQCIAEEYRCDGKFDCPEVKDEIYTPDEKGCASSEKTVCSSFEYQCQSGICLRMSNLCNGYFNDGQCPAFHDDEKYCPFIRCPDEFLRQETGACIKPAEAVYGNCTTVKDMASCPYQCPTNTYVHCCNCRCVHRVSICDGIKDCPDGADEDHCGTPDCRPDQFLCGNTTCFPLEVKCDGFDHCPEGVDERDCNNQTRKTTFIDNFSTTITPDVSSVDSQDKCFDPSVCFTSQQICRLNPNYCQMAKNHSKCFLICEDPCTCEQVGIMNCQEWEHYFNKTINEISYTIWPFKTSSVKIINQKNSIFTFEILSKLTITNASLTRIPSRILECAYNIHHLNLSFNLISQIKAGDFGRLYRLSVLDLSHNLIQSIQDFSFKGMRVFDLNLEHNVISKLGVNQFSGMAIDGSLRTDEYRLCCIRPSNLPEEDCYPKADQFSSCTDLMKDNVLRSLLWVIGFISLIGNCSVLLYKIIADRESLERNFGKMVTNLAVADVLMGVYLLTIASVDSLYRGHYITKDAEWRNSAVCSFIGVVCTISCEASVFFICLITIERYIVIRFPLGQVRLESKVINRLSFGIWATSTTIAVMPLIVTPYFQGKYFSKSGVCIALPLTTESFNGWEYSFAISVCLNFFLFLIVGIGQYLIYHQITTANRNSLVSNKRNKDHKIARRLMLVVLSDFLCWVPIGVVGIMALTGFDIPSELYAWIIVCVLPVNSALNPFFYTGLSQWFKCKKKPLKSVRSAKTVKSVKSVKSLKSMNSVKSTLST